jgi:hypothetical protein
MFFFKALLLFINITVNLKSAHPNRTNDADRPVLQIGAAAYFGKVAAK